MTEFEEIAHTGGKITFIHDPQHGTSIQLEHSRPLPAAVFQVCITLDGQIIDYIPFGGMGQGSFYPQPSVLAFLISDSEGMFGQKCPVCASYFRTSVLSRITACPYCGLRNRGVAFLTSNQIQFLTNFFNTFMAAHKEAKSIEVNLDEMVDALSNNIHSWVYKEERQQSQHKCKSCRCRYDILGHYALCPACATSNYLTIFEGALGKLLTNVEEIAKAGEVIPGDLLTKAFTEFEALGNSVRTQLLRLPATEKRKSDIAKLNFQRIIETSDSLEKWFAFKLLKDLSQEEVEFIRIMVNRRHILVHNAGRVDQRYLDITNDKTFKLNEVIKVMAGETRKTVGLLSRCGSNLVSDWQSIK